VAVTIETATTQSKRMLQQSTIKPGPAKYKTLTTETENSFKTQAFSALTGCY